MIKCYCDASYCNLYKFAVLGFVCYYKNKKVFFKTKILNICNSHSAEEKAIIFAYNEVKNKYKKDCVLFFSDKKPLSKGIYKLLKQYKIEYIFSHKNKAHNLVYYQLRRERKLLQKEAVNV